MIAGDEFDAQIEEFAKLNGLSLDEATRILYGIGDTPELNEAGEVVFEGRVIRFSA